MKPRFEGGQTSIAMRMPKARGFKRYYKLVDNYTVINVCTLDADERITNEITKEILKTNGYIKKESDLVKIL
jgi:ribosomal protein L15